MPGQSEVVFALDLHVLESVLSLVFLASLVITVVAGDRGRSREILGDRNLVSEIQSQFRRLWLPTFCVSVRHLHLVCVKGVPGTPFPRLPELCRTSSSEFVRASSGCLSFLL